MNEENARQTPAGEALAYRCPHCGAGLTYAPDTGKFACEFCLSAFDREELDRTDAAEKARRSAEEGEDYCAHMNDYLCPSCGAEIVCDETTAADFCCYCHNPIILQGKLRGQMKPDKVVPFALDEAAAKGAFSAWARKRIFAPSDFSAPGQVDKMRGIYYPFWVTDADTESEIRAHATRVRTFRRGDRMITETSHFNVTRQGEIHFEDLTTAALREADKAMLEGILPYPSDKLIPFDPSYLSGFLAKKRNIERESLTSEVQGRMQKYAKELLTATVRGYATVEVQKCHVQVNSSHWDYSLLPIWLLVYRGRKRDYTFAMNGATGKIWGQIPLCAWKVALLAVGVALAAGLLGWLIGGAVL